jgi:hypothetical protein
MRRSIASILQWAQFDLELTGLRDCGVGAIKRPKGPSIGGA